MKNSTSKPSAGRPRNEASKRAIINSTIKLLERSSFSNLTIEGIAKDSGVSKGTIYRWWKNKDDLLLSIYLETTDLKVKFDKSLSIDENFKQIIIELSRVLDSSLGKSLISVIIENKDVLQKFQSCFFEPRRLEAKDILKIGINNEVINPHINLDIILDMLFSPIYLKIFIYKESISREYIDDLISHFMNTISLKN